jgi:trimethylamine--corrinoid protein Co-methyltransferase
MKPSIEEAAMNPSTPKTEQSPSTRLREAALGDSPEQMGKLYGILNPWEPKKLEKIHQASLNILEKIGVCVANDDALDMLEGSAARVDRDTKTVRFPAAMVQEIMLNAPGSWDRISGPLTDFSVSADCGSYSVWDYASRRSRPTVARDFVDAPRLVQSLENIDAAGNLVYSMDVPPPVGDMIAYRHMWNHTKKKGGGGLGRCPSCCHALLPKSFDYLCDMLEAKIGKEKMQSDPEFSFFMGAASPLRYGDDVLKMAMHAIERGQVIGIGGNCNCGVQSPITPASNIALDHAERLAGMCIVTSIKRDAKFYFCNHTYFLDLHSLDIASGSPEQTLLALLGQKLLEHCGFQIVVNHPIMDVGAHIPDAQAGAEKMMYALLTALGGARGIGGAGQLKEEFSYEQLVIDDEIAGYVKHLLKGAEITEETIALESIEQGGIGASFLECDATLDHLREVFYPAKLFYRKRKSEWIREGAKDILTRAHEKVEEALAHETPTFLAEDQIATIDEIIIRACSELTDGWNPAPFLTVPQK